MEDLGERLVGDYLRYLKGCDFIDFNVYTKLVQGEIDVIGVDHATKRRNPKFLNLTAEYISYKNRPRSKVRT